jgi:hypothetical protein
MKIFFAEVMCRPVGLPKSLWGYQNPCGVTKTPCGNTDCQSLSFEAFTMPIAITITIERNIKA